MYRAPESSAIARRFAWIGERRMHYRVAGSGPPLLMLHQAPASSAEMVTEIESLADAFTVIAPDLPGFGQSDALADASPSLADYAIAIHAFIETLRIPRVVVYGVHTGAMIAVELGLRYPDQVAASVVNGLVVVDAAERDDLLRHYGFVPEPVADGGHLAWLWARLRDQVLFFPWYRRSIANRLAIEAPSGEALQPYVADFIRCAGGGPAYRAVFAYPTRERFGQTCVPTALLGLRADPIAMHPERLASWPDGVVRELFDDPAQLLRRVADFLGAHAPEPIAAMADVGPSGELDDCSYFVSTSAGAVHVRVLNAGCPRWTLLLHDAGESQQTWIPLAVALSRHSAVLLVDLPGHGETGMPALPDWSPASMASLLPDIVGHFGIESVRVITVGISAAIGTEFAMRAGERVTELALLDPWPLEDTEREAWLAACEPLRRCGDSGEHLPIIWRWARDGQLFRPWFRTAPANALRDPGSLDPVVVQRRAADLIKAGSAVHRLVGGLLAYNLRAALRRVAPPVRTGILRRTREGGVQAMAQPSDSAESLPAAFVDWPREWLEGGASDS